MGAAMKFGVNTMIWSGAFDSSIPLDKIKQAGLDGIEIPAFDAKDVDVPVLKRALSDSDLECTFCSVNPPGKNPISEDAAVRAETLEHWKQVVATAGEAGVQLIAGPTYSPVGHLPGRRRNDDEWKWGVDFHRQLDTALQDAGAELAIEPLNRFETYFLNTAEDTVRFVDEIGSPRIGILFDTFHSNIEEKSIPEGYQMCGSRLKHVHACENDRGVPGTGHVDWTSVLGTLRQIGYDGWLTIESFNGTIPQLAAATAIWRDLAESMDDIAFEGAAFLKRAWENENQA